MGDDNSNLKEEHLTTDQDKVLPTVPKRFKKRGVKDINEAIITVEGLRMYDIGLQVRIYRKAQGITRTELARRSGVSRQTIHRIENEECDVLMMTVLRVLKRLDLKLAVVPA